MKIKSFFNTILAVILLGALLLGFYLGWEQIDIKENSVGVVFTKTRGWRDNLLTKEGFSWSLEKLIPTNYTLHQFAIEKNSIRGDIKDSYPSGDLYADFSNIDRSNFIFSYTLGFNLKFDISFLTEFVNSGYFNEATFSNWLEEKEIAVKDSLIGYINNKIYNGETFSIKNDSLSYIKGQYPYFFIDELILNINPGDRVLYTTARSRYLNYMEEKEIAEGKFLAKKLEKESTHKANLELLKAYGEVFTQYPIMIEYIKADRGMELDRARLNDFINSQIQN